MHYRNKQLTSFLNTTLIVGNVIEGGITEQTHQSLSNIAEVLKASGSSLDKVVKTTVFLKDMNDFVAMNDVYAKVIKQRLHYFTSIFLTLFSFRSFSISINLLVVLFK